MIILGNKEIGLLGKMGLAANGYQRAEVISAAANMLLNALRQSHESRAAAENQLEALFREMRQSLADKHYDKRGLREDRKIVIPHLEPVG